MNNKIYGGKKSNARRLSVYMQFVKTYRIHRGWNFVKGVRVPTYILKEKKAISVYLKCQFANTAAGASSRRVIWVPFSANRVENNSAPHRPLAGQRERVVKFSPRRRVHVPKNTDPNKVRRRTRRTFVVRIPSVPTHF